MLRSIQHKMTTAIFFGLTDYDTVQLIFLVVNLDVAVSLTFTGLNLRIWSV